MIQSTPAANQHAISTRIDQGSPGQLGVQRQIEAQAAELLELHPQFRGRSSLIKVRYAKDRLILSGRLPSYYLKLLAQEAIRELGDYDIENNIVVFGMRNEFSPVTQARSNENDAEPVRKISK